MKYVAALDQGTTSSRTIIFDENGYLVASHAIEFEQWFPQPGWVEHNPDDILSTQIDALKAAVEKARISPKDIVAIGITNQRETTLVWDKKTGKPVYNAIVWQCRRTAPLVERLKRDGLGNMLRDKTGLIPDAYFSGTKLQWLLENVPNVRQRAEAGELCFGTVDSFLVWNLTKEHAHVTDVSNASRTMLYNIYEGHWDDMLLRAMNIPEKLLPKVVDSSCVVGKLRKDILGAEIPIAAMAGDQHAALFGQCCTRAGMAKNTYGTGSFVLMNTGSTAIHSHNDLVTTVAWSLDGKPTYALEGSVFVAGASIQWLRDQMGLIKTSAESEYVATSVPDNGGVYMVPSFTGLGAPHWDMYSRGTIIGLTRGTGRAHIVRAALEAIAYQTADVINAMAKDSGMRPDVLRVDGGASANNFLMQFQADILNIDVLRPAVIETTALGAAMLAGRAVGLWDDKQINSVWKMSSEFKANMPEARRIELLTQWSRAIERSRGWAK